MIDLAEYRKLHESCVGCGNIVEGELPCKRYEFPNRQWTKLGGCAGRTHNKTVIDGNKDFVDPLKASKKSMKKI